MTHTLRRQKGSIMKSLTSAFALSVVALSLGSASAAERPGVEHNVAKFLQSLEGGQTLDSLSPTEARAALAGAQAASNVALPAVEVSEKTMHVNDSDLKLTIVRPAGSQQKTLPAFMYFHGGGWVLGEWCGSGTTTQPTPRHASRFTHRRCRRRPSS
jgi:acetyl esterase